MAGSGSHVPVGKKWAATKNLFSLGSRRPSNLQLPGRVQNTHLPNTIAAATTGASLPSPYPHTPPCLAPRYPPRRFVHPQPNLRPPSSARSFLPGLCFKKPCCPTLCKVLTPGPPAPTSRHLHHSTTSHSRLFSSCRLNRSQSHNGCPSSAGAYLQARACRRWRYRKGELILIVIPRGTTTRRWAALRLALAIAGQACTPPAVIPSSLNRPKPCRKRADKCLNAIDHLRQAPLDW